MSCADSEYRTNAVPQIAAHSLLSINDGCLFILYSKQADGDGKIPVTSTVRFYACGVVLMPCALPATVHSQLEQDRRADVIAAGIVK